MRRRSRGVATFRRPPGTSAPMQSPRFQNHAAFNMFSVAPGELRSSSTTAIIFLLCSSVIRLPPRKAPALAQLRTSLVVTVTRTRPDETCLWGRALPYADSQSRDGLGSIAPRAGQSLDGIGHRHQITSPIWRKRGLNAIGRGNAGPESSFRGILGSKKQSRPERPTNTNSFWPLCLPLCGSAEWRSPSSWRYSSQSSWLRRSGRYSCRNPPRLLLSCRLR